MFRGFIIEASLSVSLLQEKHKLANTLAQWAKIHTIVVAT